MFDFISRPWPWYVAGPLIGLTVPVLLLLGNKSFGISSSLRHICAACIPANISFFKYDWKKEAWNLFFVAGILFGGFIAAHFLANPNPVQVNPKLANELASYGIDDYNQLVPVQLMNWTSLFTLKGFLVMVFGGFLVGFGTRYAGGCTSGHAIMGLSNLQWPSLVATICFMAGGFIMANFFIANHFIIIVMENKESKGLGNLKYLVLGTLFGIVFVKAEIVSWFRIQEMFRLQSFHMYGVIGSAVVVGMLSVFIIKKFKIKSLSGEPITLQPKQFNKGQIYGGLLFGFGWALTGACPGPLFAQIGTGATVVAVTLLSAIAGTWFLWFNQRKVTSLMEQILIITGGSKGIGRGIIEAYLAKGVRVFSIARSVDTELSAKGVTQISFDLTQTGQVEHELEAIFELLNVDEIAKITLVNNAGTLGEIAPLEKLEAEVIEQVFKLNTVVPYICSAAFVRLTRKISGEKSILNISSGAALKPYYGWSTYCGSKAALNMLTQNLALEQQDVVNGVKVLAIAPGVVDTDMQAQIRKSDKDDFKDVERFVALKTEGGLNDATTVGESIYQMDHDETIVSGAILRVEGK